MLSNRLFPNKLALYDTFQKHEDFFLTKAVNLGKNEVIFFNVCNVKFGIIKKNSDLVSSIS